ncbi:hypothetical protein P154DRAFT_565716 [Amniculicola lignicola CBS 123094]|uniref:Uncharacterized protein n=1 Tax=Amniculicola lignicola CBS 123094 TaxID=1392246 RepID=A0A6A5W731_9PLEO|nr:hypothetical protein P154DRAFT_565716 [Amniculicola lignicola CBS 123094]
MEQNVSLSHSKSAMSRGWRFHRTYANYYCQTWEGGEWHTAWRDWGPNFSVRDPSFYVPGRIFAVISQYSGGIRETLMLEQHLVTERRQEWEGYMVCKLDHISADLNNPVVGSLLTVSQLNTVYDQEDQRIVLNTQSLNPARKFEIRSNGTRDRFYTFNQVVMEIGQVVDEDIEKLTGPTDKEAVIRFHTRL